MLIFKPHEAISVIQEHIPHATTIVEAGAFNGHDTIKLAQHFPQATIHTFEPMPNIYEILQKNTAHYQNIITYPYALSNKNGTAPFYVAQKPNKPDRPTQAGTLNKPLKRLSYSSVIYPQITHCKTVTFDSWAQDNNIKNIDLLWLDLQGHEYAVLSGALSLLPHIKMIYTEVHFVQSYCDHPLYQEFKIWLQQHHFIEIGKDFNSEIDSFFGNSLFIKK